MADYYESADMLPSQVRLPKDLTKKDDAYYYKSKKTLNQLSIRTPSGKTDGTPKSARSNQNTSRTKF